MIYLDNAATSCPKPPEVVAAVAQALQDVCANPSRGAYELSLEASRSLLRTRRAAARLFGIRDEARVIFTLNATHALNMALKGLLGSATAGRDRAVRTRHVVTSSLEHNSVVRPLAVLAAQGVEITRVPCGSDGSTDPGDVLAAVRADTALVVLTHASNVLGTVLPVAEIGPRLRERGVPLLVDAAQTAGCFPIDVEAMGISLLAVSGHKGLLGPQGVGILYVAPHMELETLFEGGTGSRSESSEQPSTCPDRFEAGTPNSPGIAGLGAGIRVVEREGVAESGRRQYELALRLFRGLDGAEGITVFGPWGNLSSEPSAAADAVAGDASDADGATDPPGAAVTGASWIPPVAPIVSLAVDGLTSAEVARVLDREFQIAVRAGLHCAPEAHRVAGTLEGGLVRLSIGHSTTEAEVAEAVAALLEIAGRPARHWLTEWEGHYAQ